MWKEKFLTSLRTNPLPLLFALVGLILIFIGIVSMVLAENRSQGVIIEEAASDAARSNDIIVDVAGAVLMPDVYKLKGDARMQDALIAAGGLAQDADREYVSKHINLAMKVSDGAKIYVPNKSEKLEVKSQNYGGEVSKSDGLVNINAASSSELEELAGIGQKTAQKIIDNRPYSSVEELLTKKVVGQKVFEEIKDKVTAY